MSIIYDALKKVEEDTNKAAESLNTASQCVKQKSKARPIFLYLLVVCLGLYIGNFAFNYLPQTNKIAGQQPKPVKTPDPIPLIKETPAKVIPVAPLPPKEALNKVNVQASSSIKPTLVLNGVFLQEGSVYALINNRIVREGDEIDRAKVKHITLKNVELDFEGKTIRLFISS